MNEILLSHFIIKESRARNRDVSEDLKYLDLLKHYWWYDVRTEEDKKSSLESQLEKKLSWCHLRFKELFDLGIKVEEAEKYREKVEEERYDFDKYIR